MQGQDTNNVVSIFAKKAKHPTQAQTQVDAGKEISLDDAMRRNADNKKRMATERDKANKSVLKSYRIKT